MRTHHTQCNLRHIHHKFRLKGILYSQQLQCQCIFQICSLRIPHRSGCIPQPLHITNNSYHHTFACNMNMSRYFLPQLTLLSSHNLRYKRCKHLLQPCNEHLQLKCINKFNSFRMNFYRLCILRLHYSFDNCCLCRLNKRKKQHY